MADNVAVTPGTGATFATDDIGGIQYPRVKISQGADGSGTDVSSAAPLNVTLANGSVPSHAVTNAGTFAVQNTAATPAGTNNIGDVDVLTVNGVAPAFGAGASGATVQRVVIASDQLDPTVAHDAADSGAPYKQGFKATTSLAGLTLVANADRTDGFAGLDGVQIVRPHCNLEDLISGVAAITDGSSTSVIASAGAGVKNYVTTAIIANTSATAVTVDLRDGASGTVKATLPVPANTSGVVCNLPVPLGFSAATAVCADPSAAASTITVTLLGFKSKV